MGRLHILKTPILLKWTQVSDYSPWLLTAKVCHFRTLNLEPVPQRIRRWFRILVVVVMEMVVEVLVAVELIALGLMVVVGMVVGDDDGMVATSTRVWERWWQQSQENCFLTASIQGQEHQWHRRSWGYHFSVFLVLQPPPNLTFFPKLVSKHPLLSLSYSVSF